MPSIHIVKNDPKLPAITPVQKGSNTFRSGYWAVSPATANILKNGKIYFHEKQAKPSFFGGTISHFEVVTEGEHKGRIIFFFEREPTCKNVKTSPSGWAQEMKIIT
jgi:hypothetical protein